MYKIELISENKMSEEIKKSNVFAINIKNADDKYYFIDSLVEPEYCSDQHEEVYDSALEVIVSKYGKTSLCPKLDYVIAVEDTSLDTIASAAMLCIIKNDNYSDQWSKKEGLAKRMFNLNEYIKEQLFWSPKPLVRKPSANECEILDYMLKDDRISEQEKLGKMVSFLWEGNIPTGYKEKVLAHKESVHLALEHGDTEVTYTNGVTIINTSHPRPLDFGFNLSPVVIVFHKNKEGYYIVSQYAEGYLNMTDLTISLSLLGYTWSKKSNTLLESESGCLSTIQQVLEQVKKNELN